MKIIKMLHNLIAQLCNQKLLFSSIIKGRYPIKVLIDEIPLIKFPDNGGKYEERL